MVHNYQLRNTVEKYSRKMELRNTVENIRVTIGCDGKAMSRYVGPLFYFSIIISSSQHS